MAELQILVVMPLVCGFVLFHDARLYTAAGIDRQALLGRPEPDFAGIRGSWTSCPNPSAGLSCSFGVATEYFAQFTCMSVIEVNCIFDAIEGKHQRLTCLGAVEVIFQKGYYSLCHKKSIGVVLAKDGRPLLTKLGRNSKEFSLPNKD